MALLKELQLKNQCTIIVVTHDARILPFADRIINIEDGYIKETTLSQTSSHAASTISFYYYCKIAAL